MPAWMIDIADKIRTEYSEEVNHAIVIEYAHGQKHYAPPHKDKLPPGTGFYVFTFGDPREFQFLGDPTGPVKNKKRTHGEADVVWSHALPSNSLLVVPSDANDLLYHAVPQDRAWTGVRYSLIFRTINTTAAGKRKRPDAQSAEPASKRMAHGN
jgi:hypothetical protein